MSVKHSTYKSFKYAFNGIKEAFVNEPNFRIHTGISLLVILAAIFFQFNSLEFILLILTISFVVTLELINTTLETIVNMTSPQYQEKAKIAKDISAAAVFVSAITSVVVGGFLFLPKIFGLFYLLY